MNILKSKAVIPQLLLNRVLVEDNNSLAYIQFSSQCNLTVISNTVNYIERELGCRFVQTELGYIPKDRVFVASSYSDLVFYMG